MKALKITGLVFLLFMAVYKIWMAMMKAGVATGLTD